MSYSVKMPGVIYLRGPRSAGSQKALSCTLGAYAFLLALSHIPLAHIPLAHIPLAHIPLAHIPLVPPSYAEEPRSQVEAFALARPTLSAQELSRPAQLDRGANFSSKNQPTAIDLFQPPLSYTPLSDFDERGPRKGRTKAYPQGHLKELFATLGPTGLASSSAASSSSSSSSGQAHDIELGGNRGQQDQSSESPDTTDLDNLSATELNDTAVEAIMAGESARAERRLLKALEKNPSDVTAHYNLSGLLISTGEFDRASRHLTAALDLDPEDESVMKRLADLHIHQQRYSAARELYSSLLELNPDSEELALRVGALWGMAGNWEETEAQFRSAAVQHPHSERVLGALGSTLLIRGKLSDAVLFLEQAQELKRTPASALALGAAHDRLGRPETALTYYIEARHLGASERGLMRRIERLSYGRECR